MECIVCYSTMNTIKLYCCGKNVCLLCLNKWINEENNFPTKCISCSENLLYNKLEIILNKVDLKKYKEFLMEKMFSFQEKMININIEKNFIYINCIQDFCRGFVTEESKCILCGTEICFDCGVKKNLNHKCKIEDINNIIEIKKSSKSCPLCKINIIKNGGCDHMTCTHCKCEFNWSTLKITKIYINLDQTYGNQIHFNHIWYLTKKYRYRKYILDYSRVLFSVKDIIKKYPIYINNFDNIDLREKYLKNQMTKDNMKKNLFKRYIETQNNLDIRKCIIDLYRNGIIIINQIQNISDEKLYSQLKELFDKKIPEINSYSKKIYSKEINLLMDDPEILIEYLEHDFPEKLVVKN